MASSVNFSSCQFNSFLYRSPRLKYSSFPSRQLKCFHSPPRSSRQLKYSFSPCRQLKYPFSPSRQLKYFSSPSCQLKDSSPSSLQLKDSSSSRQWKYQVFLSFRFETRRNFTSQLLKALKDTGMNVFFDEEKLEKGEQFLGQLTQSIEVSNLSIIILSADYASSDVCLTELSQIMDLKHNQGHIVLPIFFHVDPSDVQNISGTFQKSFDAHEPKQPPPCDEEKLKQWKLKQQKVKQWKADLAQVGTLKGVHIKGDRPETEHIKHIVECAINKLMKHQVFLSFGEDTRHNFSSHLLKALEDTGINVISDDKTEIEISQAIAASNLSIVVLSEDYAVSESCLAQLSCIMARQRTQKHIFLPIFYHVKPDELKLGRSENFAEVADLQGLIIEGGYSDRPDTEHIKVVVRDVIQKLNRKSRSVSDELIGIDDQKETILRLIGQEKNRLIGLWGMGGIGKTTLVDAVYNEITLVFDSRCFVHNVRRQIEDKGMISVRNELLTNLLGNKTDIDTPSIGCLVTQDRLKNKRVFVVLDDVNDSDLMDLMGVKYFGEGSKIIVTSRDRQVLKNGGADEIYKVKKLNDKDSLQLFSRFAFKLSNPALDFQDLWNKFLEYAQGNPLALKVLGSKLYTKSRKEWEGEVDKLKEYPQQKISQILRSSFDELDKLEKDIFLDIACFFKRELKEDVEEILSCLYKGAACGISNLLDKCLVHIDSYGRICMHDMLEEMGKDIVRRESKDPGERSRLWSLKDMIQELKYNKVNKSIEGIKLFVSRLEDQLLLYSGFEKMHNLRYIILYTFPFSVTSVSFSDELRYLHWDFCPLKSLSSNFNPKNLVVLKLRDSFIEQLWKEDHQDLVNLRSIDLSGCTSLVEIPNLSGAINLQSLCCNGCESLVELPSLNQLVSIESLDLSYCKNLRKIPNPFRAINLKSLECYYCTSLVELSCLNQLVSLESLDLSYCKNLRKIPNPFGAINLKSLKCKYCTSLVELPSLNKLVSLESLDLSFCENLRKISDPFGAINLKSIKCNYCTSLIELPSLNQLVSLESLDLSYCENLRKNPEPFGAINLKSLECYYCTSLVELSCLNHLASLEELGLKGCHKLKKFPELPNNFCELDLRYTEIQEVPDSIQHLVGLRKLSLSHSRVENLSSNISKLESLNVLELEECRRIKTLSELPRYLRCLNANYCRSLEKVSFTDHNSNSFFSLHDGDDTPREEKVSMSFLNCFKLNQDSIKNIERNAVLQIQSLAQRWARRKGRGSFGNQFFCCFPGYEVPANEFEHRSVNPWLNLKIAANGCSGSRFLAFALCFLANFWSADGDVGFICEYQLTAASGKKFMRESRVSWRGDRGYRYKAHVFIVFNKDMIIRDNDYEEASFEFYIKDQLGRKYKAVEWGVHVFYVDAESYSISDMQLHNIAIQMHCIILLCLHGFSELADICRRYPCLRKFDYKGDHVFFLFNQDMIIIDNDYEEASFELYIGNPYGNEFKVEKCGVNIFYMDAEGYTISDVMRWDKSYENSDSQKDARGELREDAEEILSCFYKGVTSGISNLIDKTLLHMDSNRQISMYEEMGKDLVRQKEDLCGGYFGGHHLTDYIAMLRTEQL
ncbi:disease resistance protein TAO1-like [Hibiscus syriacus]|uniref:disease resistance protein TAO1-like n=1 Tax=Hibiscus syriacus TaxID=106335 RepID=UPI0019249575|nr:disease resistance protein TAO1-like [Hibiscus syriacus]